MAKIMGDFRLRYYYTIIVPFFDKNLTAQPDGDRIQLKAEPYNTGLEVDWVKEHLERRYPQWSFRFETLDKAWTKITAVKKA